MDFRRWPQYLSDNTEVWAVQLPGRDTRRKEAPSKRLSTIVREIAAAIPPFLELPFAFFGHSLGAMTAFEVARVIRRDLNLEPVHLFVSGCRAPQLPYEDLLLHRMPDDQLLNELRRLNGTPSAVLESAELMALMLPLIRADLEMIETYDYTSEAPLSCPLSVYGGLLDTAVRREQLEAWRDQTTARFRLRFFDGDHFFIRHAESLLVQDVKMKLNVDEDAHLAA
jgi:surfactin synthase thioesterase subunit